MKNYIKLGIGVYIGWQIASGINGGLNKLFGNKLKSIIEKVKE